MLLLEKAIMRKKELERILGIVEKQLKDAPKGNLVSLKNEPMRSKSEVIIANLLNERNVPYHYEYPVHMKNGATFHVDFLCLNTRTRQEFYWEHCGRMDDLEYTTNMTF